MSDYDDEIWTDASSGSSDEENNTRLMENPVGVHKDQQFYLRDFTVVTGWESFVHQLEEIVENNHVEPHTNNDQWCVNTQTIEYAGISIRVSYCRHLNEGQSRDPILACKNEGSPWKMVLSRYNLTEFYIISPLCETQELVQILPGLKSALATIASIKLDVPFLAFNKWITPFWGIRMLKDRTCLYEVTGLTQCRAFSIMEMVQQFRDRMNDLRPGYSDTYADNVSIFITHTNRMRTFKAESLITEELRPTDDFDVEHALSYYFPHSAIIDPVKEIRLVWRSPEMKDKGKIYEDSDDLSNPEFHLMAITHNFSYAKTMGNISERFKMCFLWSKSEDIDPEFIFRNVNPANKIIAMKMISYIFSESTPQAIALPNLQPQMKKICEVKFGNSVLEDNLLKKLVNCMSVASVFGESTDDFLWELFLKQIRVLRSSKGVSDWLGGEETSSKMKRARLLPVMVHVSATYILYLYDLYFKYLSQITGFNEEVQDLMKDMNAARNEASVEALFERTAHVEWTIASYVSLLKKFNLNFHHDEFEHLKKETAIQLLNNPTYDGVRVKNHIVNAVKYSEMMDASELVLHYTLRMSKENECHQLDGRFWYRKGLLCTGNHAADCIEYAGVYSNKSN